jgi:hypothetical protein
MVFSYDDFWTHQFPVSDKSIRPGPQSGTNEFIEAVAAPILDSKEHELNRVVGSSRASCIRKKTNSTRFD